MGYFVRNDRMMHCNGFDECEEIDDACKEDDEGNIGLIKSENSYSSDKEYELCFGEHRVPLKESNTNNYSFNTNNNDETKHIAFTTTKANNIYGNTDKNKIIILSVTSKEVLIETLPDGEEKIFINQSYNSTIADSKPLIKCNGSNCEAMDNPADSENNIYYIDGFSKKNIITCNKDGCTSENKCSKNNESKYFMDGSNEKNIITCTNTECVSEKYKKGIYIVDSKALILCNTNGCQSIENKKVCAAPEDEGNVYIDSIGLSICKSDGTWKSFRFSTISLKYVLSKSLANKLFGNITNDYILVTAEPSSLLYQEKPVNGYYTNSDTTEKDIPYIKCDSKTCTGFNVTEENCTEENVGKLISVSNTVSLCRDVNATVPIDTNTDTFLYYNANNNIFELESNQYALVSVSVNYYSKSITLKDVNASVTYYANESKERSKKPLIESIGSIYSFIDSYSTTTAYYLDGSDNKNIITCDGSDCVSKTANYGYYLNGGEDKELYDYIRCIYFHGCSKLLVKADTCEYGMDLIKKDNKYYICIKDAQDKNVKNLVELKVDKNSKPTTYEMSYTQTIGNLKGSSDVYLDKTYKIRVGNDGSAILYTNAILDDCAKIESADECVTEACPKQCYFTAYGGENCIKDKIIRLTTSPSEGVYSCKAIDSEGFIAEGLSSNERIHFFTEFYEEINEISRGMGTINIAYKCTHGAENIVTNCEMASGTFIIGNDSVVCTGYRQDYCVVGEKGQNSSSNSGSNSGSNPGSVTDTDLGSGTGTDSNNNSTPSTPETTINDDNKNKENSGALSLYYKLPSLLFYVILFILPIFVHL